MKNYIVGITCFIAGVITGGGASYLYFKKKNEEILAEEIAEIKEAYYNAEMPSQNAVLTHQEARRAILDDGDGEINVELEKARKLAQDDLNKPDILSFKRASERKNYSTIIADSGYHDNPHDNDKPVGEREFDETYPVCNDDCEGGYELIDMTYYENDDVLCEDGHEEDPLDINEVLSGLDLPSYFGPQNEDPDMCYFKNDARKEVYAISRSTVDWTDSSYGVEPFDDGLED